MGFTDGHPCVFSLDMKQTPETVRKVLDIAGWTVEEAALETGIDAGKLGRSTLGRSLLFQSEWRLLLDKAGRRAFDWDGDAE